MRFLITLTEIKRSKKKIEQIMCYPMSSPFASLRPHKNLSPNIIFDKGICNLHRVDDHSGKWSHRQVEDHGGEHFKTQADLGVFLLIFLAQQLRAEYGITRFAASSKKKVTAIFRKSRSACSTKSCQKHMWEAHLTVKQLVQSKQRRPLSRQKCRSQTAIAHLLLCFWKMRRSNDDSS